MILSVIYIVGYTEIYELYHSRLCVTIATRDYLNEMRYLFYDALLSHNYTVCLLNIDFLI